MKSRLSKIVATIMFSCLLALNVNSTKNLYIGAGEVNARSLNNSPCWGAGEIGPGRYVECPTCTRVLHYNPKGPSSTCTKVEDDEEQEEP